MFLIRHTEVVEWNTWVGGGREAVGLVGSMTYRGKADVHNNLRETFAIKDQGAKGPSNSAEEQRDQGDKCRRRKGRGKARQGRKQVRMSMGVGVGVGVGAGVVVVWCTVVCILYSTLVWGQGNAGLAAIGLSRPVVSRSTSKQSAVSTTMTSA